MLRDLPGRRDGGLPQALDDSSRGGKPQSAPDQPVPDQSAALRLAALDSADRPAQGWPSLLVRMAFKVAKHDRRTIFQRQPVHLLVDRGKHIGIEKCPHLDAADRILLRVTLFMPAASNTGRPQIRRRAAGDLMEPGPQRVAHPERSCLANQDEEGGLKGIFRLMLIANDGQANAPDHRFMPLDERREGQLGYLIRIGRESFQELAVGQGANGPEIV